MNELRNLPGRPSEVAPPPPHPEQLDPRPLRIEAIAVACGGPMIEELALFTLCAKAWHPELPIYALTDEEGESQLDEGTRRRIDYLRVVTSEEMEAIAETEALDQGKRWSRRWIGAKLEAFRAAIEHYGDRGILFCDSDLIFTRRLEALEWDADLVLSTHVGPLLRTQVPASHGFYNAGLVLASELGVVERWIELYRKGVGSFLEQHCLERLSEEFVSDRFPPAWNWGTWRWQEHLGRSGRRPAILHVHLAGPHASEHAPTAGENRHPNHKVYSLATEAVENARAAEDLPDRLAFLHCPKAAGSSLAYLLRHEVAPKRCYQMLNGFGKVNAGLQRDWVPGELDLIRVGKLWGQVGKRWIVHNHSQNWDEVIVDRFLENGWKFFSLYRPIRERLVSLYFWGRSRPDIRGRSLEEFLREVLGSSAKDKEWILPEWAVENCNWYVATDDGLRDLCFDFFSLEVEARRENTSENPGFEAAREKGLISNRLVKMLDRDSRVEAWDRFAEERGLTYFPRS